MYYNIKSDYSPIFLVIFLVIFLIIFLVNKNFLFYSKFQPDKQGYFRKPLLVICSGFLQMLFKAFLARSRHHTSLTDN